MLLLALLVGGLAAYAWVPWFVLLQISLGCAVVGLGVGIPGAWVYHVRLRASLLENGTLERGWWISPFGLHATLAPAQLDRVLPPCWVGAAGGTLAFVGCLIGGIGVLASFS